MTAFNTLSAAEFDALIQRVEQARDNQSCLSTEDLDLVLDALLSLAEMQGNLADKDITITKLKKLAGIVRSSETLTGETQKRRKHRATKVHNTPVEKIKPVVCYHPHKALHKGMVCPECGGGKLAKYSPATFLRIIGQSPFVAEQHVMERLRCNACGVYFDAEVPEDVTQDGSPYQQYGFSARTLMAVGKFFSGNPYYRQGSLQQMLGVPLSASTICDQVRYLAQDISPVVKLLTRLAAQGKLLLADDTSHRILSQAPVEMPKRNGKGTQVRSGVYCSAMISVLDNDKEIVLFRTNIGHAGDLLDSVLAQRDEGISAPVLMTDALSCNQPANVSVVKSLCNSHARRKFVDVEAHFPDEAGQVLNHYGKIWDNEVFCRKNYFDEAARLVHHQVHSLPVMKFLKNQCETWIVSHQVEENSSLGGAIQYFLNHYEGLSAFCRVSGAPIDNNKMEALLKLRVRDRKNAMFHKTAAGANTGDMVTSIIATCHLNHVNVLDYLNVLQRESFQARLAPHRYLPWNYTER